MELCLNTSCFCNPFEPPAITLPEKLRIAAEVGYRELELWVAELDAHVAGGADLEGLKRDLDKAGLTVRSMIGLRGWMESAGDDHAEVLAECRRRMEIASELGCPNIVASPPAVRQPEFYHLDFDHAAARYRELIALGEPLGVVPMVEFLGFSSSIYQLEQAETIVKLADHPKACLVLDPFHLWRGGSSFKRVGSLDPTRIGICHFNDAPTEHPPRFQQVDADRVYPGEGDLPLVQMLRDLRAAGYQGSLSLELFSPDHWALPAEKNIRQGWELTHRVLEQAAP